MPAPTYHTGPSWLGFQPCPDHTESNGESLSPKLNPSPASHQEDRGYHFPSWSIPRLSILEAFTNRMKKYQNQNKVKSSLGLVAISLKVPMNWRGLKMFPECEVRETRRLPSKERAAPCTLTQGSVLCCWDSLLSPCGFWITFKTGLSLAMVFLEAILWFSN